MPFGGALSPNEAPVHPQTGSHLKSLLGEHTLPRLHCPSVDTGVRLTTF